MKLNRSHMFVPGNSKSDIHEAFNSKVDVVILDLEDQVPKSEKEAAMENIISALRQSESDIKKKQIFVRVNGLDTSIGISDIETLLQHNVQMDAIMLPKVKTGEYIKIVDRILRDNESEVGIVPLIETPEAIFNIYSIVNSSRKIHAIDYGSIDFQQNMGVLQNNPTADYLPRHFLSMAASIADVPCVDTAYMNVENVDELREECIEAYKLGFDGKMTVDERQIDVIHNIFTPNKEQVRRAENIIESFEEKDDEGAMIIDGELVDKPVVEEQKKLLNLYEQIKTK